MPTSTSNTFVGKQVTQDLSDAIGNALEALSLMLSPVY